MKTGLVLMIALAGCTNTWSVSGSKEAIPQVRVRAESDLDCPQAEIVVVEEVGGRLKAVGCGQKALYHAACNGVSCVVRAEGERPIPFKERPDPDQMPY